MKPLIITVLASLILFTPSTKTIGERGDFGKPKIVNEAILSQSKFQQQNTITYIQTAVQSASNTACGDNSYAQYIYQHESGCSLYDPNLISGACGIGQAWPCSKLTAICPNLDYACENTFFTNYANSAYGGWANSYYFWQEHHWW